MFRELPSVNELLDHDSVRELIGEHGRLRVTDWVRSAIRTEREKLSESSKPAAEGTGSPVRSDIREAVIEAVTELAARSEWQSMAGVINATGVILHTGLGRAPLSSTARQALLDCAGACNCEVDVETGERRYRGYQVESMLQLLTGAEASLIVNNNAAATLLTLQALCSGREVIISRGELIEIGGSFRLPDIFELSGVRLKEVGTTNRTRLSDYERAITEDTAGIMVVHPSNYRVTGFTGKPDLKEIVALARQRDLVAIDDIGSGSLSDLSASGRPHEPTFQESVAAGADVTLGSGDKLLGGPQSGIIVGRGDLVDRLRNHALARAVRVDKLTLAALDATLAAYVRGTAPQEVPTLMMLSASIDALRERAVAVVDEIGTVEGLRIEVREGCSPVGGGALPTVELPTAILALRHQSLTADGLARQLRTGRIRVFSRVQQDEVLLDLRSVLPDDMSRLVLAVRLLARHP